MWFELRDERAPSLLDVAPGLRRPRRPARPTASVSWWRRVRLLPRLAGRVTVVLLRGRRAPVAGEGDLLAQLERLRRPRRRGPLHPQSGCPPALPRCIGVVTGEAGKARDDVLAGLRRRGWAGRIVWAFAPVQDRHAAPAVATRPPGSRGLREVEVMIVARGGGSVADLFAFCDETLCRTVALLRVPVIASVGHHTDRTLIDDVAAVSCSTPSTRPRPRFQSTARARGQLHAAARRAARAPRRRAIMHARGPHAAVAAPADHVPATAAGSSAGARLRASSAGWWTALAARRGGSGVGRMPSSPRPPAARARGLRRRGRRRGRSARPPRAPALDVGSRSAAGHGHRAGAVHPLVEAAAGGPVTRPRGARRSPRLTLHGSPAAPAGRPSPGARASP